MIAVTRLDGTAMIVNSDQIAWIEYNPDTVVALTNGEKLIVRESPDILVERIRDFKRSTHEPPHPSPRTTLSIVEPTGREP
jgi:flagellar protein FlbD